MNPLENLKTIEHQGVVYETAKLNENLGKYLTDARREKIEQVLSRRTIHFIPILEKIFDTGNISAVQRSAESLGFCQLNVIDNHRFKGSARISKGAEKWLSMTRFESTKECILSLRASGYRVYATHLSADAVPITEIDFSQKSAVILGSEGFGVSEEALEYCDQNVLIPMDGFTQSYNISVAAALLFYHVRMDRIARLGSNADLTPEQLQYFRALYYLRSAPESVEKVLTHVMKES
jgi:tRNA (guanosine-2'-O-)-methyltransferase